jgi:phage gp16-like protein
MKIKIAPRKCGVVELFDSIARQMGYKNASELNYDCTKINVAKNIQDMFYEFYTQLTKEADNTISDSDIRIGITMLLAMSGPKVDENLAENEVEIFEGFIC